ncbi:MAG: hypothetical protein OD918_04235 [Gammaproteobacteria bacterium]
MNWKYLGDSKDAFKWDYLDFLAGELRVDVLYYVSMWTLEEETKEGKIPPKKFSAHGGKIQRMCARLQNVRNATAWVLGKTEWLLRMVYYKCLHNLPKRDGRHRYHVRIHKPKVAFCDSERDDYFCGIAPAKQIVFLDPDTGFQAQKRSKKHVRYSDIETIWPQIDDDTLAVVFQHAKFGENFSAHYQTIKKELHSRLESFNATAVCWPGKVMLVVFGKSGEQAAEARRANKKYKNMANSLPAHAKIETLDDADEIEH